MGQSTEQTVESNPKHLCTFHHGAERGCGIEPKTPFIMAAESNLLEHLPFTTEQSGAVESNLENQPFTTEQSGAVESNL